MLKFDRLPRAAGAVSALALLLGFIFGAPLATANVLPEAAMLIHVRPALPEGQGCTTAITNCTQIVHTTSAEGQLEFLVFFYPLAYQDNHYPIHHLTANLAWPDTWQFVRWNACGGADGSLQTDGPDHTLSLTWPACPPISGTLFLVASLVLDVTGPGRLTFAPSYQVPVWLGCPPGGFDAEAVGFYADAGVECGYSLMTCAFGEWCAPDFGSEELALTAPVGGIDEGQVPFTAVSGAGPSNPCALTVTPHASWAQATVVPGIWPNYHLAVTADATGLDEGTHETWIEVVAWGTIARCVKVTFTVTRSTAGLGEPEYGDRVRWQSWGQIKDRYRRP